MRRKRAWICLILVLSLVLTGCQLDFAGYFENLKSLAGYYGETDFSDMVYTRPDMDACQAALEESCEVFSNTANLNDVLNAINSYYDVYDDYYTNFDLAYIHYCQDVTDAYWQAEYSFFLDSYAQIDAGLEALYRALGASSWRDILEGDNYFGEGFFLAYDGESVWDETFMQMLSRESELINEYNSVFEQSLAAEYYSEEYFTLYGAQMAEIFVELVAQRQAIAAYAGYGSYPEFAYDFYYYRDYTPQEAQAYLSAIPEEMYELYCQVNQSDVWEIYNTYCAESSVFAYGRETAQAMGGEVWNAFQHLEENGVYDISYGANKYTTSFELYLYTYYTPYLFTCPTGDPSDKLTFVHEFGHFAADYVCYGSYAGTDVAEIHSQAMEYLSLLYGPADEALVELKMADCLMLYVEQAALALFEQQVYGLTGDELTVENVQALYESIGLRFGFDSWDWDCRDYVTVSHFYSNPMYIVSYVTSNDVALQIYQLEKEETGAGLALYEQALLSQESYLIYFAESSGLVSPFAEGRIHEVSQSLREILG